MGRKNRRKKTHYKRLYLPEKPRRESRKEKTDIQPKRMEIWLADLPLHQDSHVQGGARPVVIVSNDIGNTHAGTVTVLPLTTKMKKKAMPTHAMVKETGTPSQALAEQIITIDKWRLVRSIGICEKTDEIERAMKAQLGLLPQETKHETEELPNE